MTEGQIEEILNDYKSAKPKLQAMGQDQLYSLNAEINSYIVEKLKTLGDRQIINLHDYGKDFLEKDVYIAFLKDFAKKCIAAKKIDWISRYLRMYLDDSDAILEKS